MFEVCEIALYLCENARFLLSELFCNILIVSFLLLWYESCRNESMMELIKYIFLFLLCRVPVFSQDTTTVVLDLEKAIEIALRKSPDVIAARHNFRSQYWSYCYYKANYLPSLTFTSTPNFNHSINPITQPDGTSTYIQQNQLMTNGNLTINQNVALTGGSFFVISGIQRMDVFENEETSYKTTPFTFGYTQSLLGYNSLKWDRKIEPLRFEEAKKSYIETLELVSSRTVLMFFNLAMAQTNLQIAQTNYANADTLYHFAQGRYNIGTITENEMLQLEISRLTEESNMLNAQINVDNDMHNLRTYLGMADHQQIAVNINPGIPSLVIDVHQALQYALANSPDMLTMKRRLLESESAVSYAKANRGLKADLYAEFGLTKKSDDLSEAYKDPSNQQYVELGIRIPILDWGRGKGRVKVAESSRDMTRTQVEQDRITFEQNVQKMVKQFNIQSGNIHIAEKTDKTAERRNEVARRLYILGKSTILDLNASISEKDSAKRSYISALSYYWSLYYGIRSMTLHDFEKDIPLTEDYELLLK